MKRLPSGNGMVSPSGGTTPQQRKDARRTANENARSATSEKLDWLNALRIDPRLRPSDYKVASALISFRNAITGVAYPSYETLADETCLKPETVRTCVKKLSEAGWIKVQRPKRSMPNVYKFSHEHVNAMLDRRTMLRDARAEIRQERSNAKMLAAFDRDEDNGPCSWDRDEDNGPQCDSHHGKHLSEHIICLAGKGVQ